MSNSSTSGATVQEREPSQNDLDGLLWKLVEHCWANDPKGRLWAVADDASLAKLEGVTIEAMIGWKLIVSGADMVEPTVRALVKDGFMVEVDGRFRPTPAGVKRHDKIIRESGPRLASDDEIKVHIRNFSAQPPRKEYIASHPDEPMTKGFIEVADDGTKTVNTDIIEGSSQRLMAEMSADSHPRCGGVWVKQLPGYVETALCAEGLSASARNPKFRIESVILDMERSGEIERVEAGPETAYLDLRGEERQEEVWRLTVPAVTATDAGGNDKSAKGSESEPDQTAAEIAATGERQDTKVYVDPRIVKVREFLLNQNDRRKEKSELTIPAKAFLKALDLSPVAVKHPGEGRDIRNFRNKLNEAVPGARHWFSISEKLITFQLDRRPE